MRACFLILSVPLIAMAQFPPAEVSGALLECDANVPAGEFAIRGPDFQVYRFQFDAKTSVERDTFWGGVNRLRPGDQVSVDSVPVVGSLVRYAATVHVVIPKMPTTLADSRLQRAGPTLFPIPQTSTLIFAGVVSKVNSQSLVLHTREPASRRC